MFATPFQDAGFRRELEHALAGAHCGAADPDEVLDTAARIRDGDPDSWLYEWTATGGAAWAAAHAAERGGHPISALGHYRRAATYYATALQLIAFTDEAHREPELWRRQRDCWERVVDLLAARAERFAVPYEDTTLPGYLFPAPDAAPGESRPLVVVHGGDEPTSQSWVHGGAAAAERGYHWMTFDGPGQQAALVEQGLTARPDWEAVLTPVVDALLVRPDVDAARVAVIGTGSAGYWIARALAFEHRFAAAAVDPGVVDLTTTWTCVLPPAVRVAIDAGDASAFVRDLRLAELLHPACTVRLRAWAARHGLQDVPRSHLFDAMRDYRLGDELGAIATPLLVIEPDRDNGWPRQSSALYEGLAGPKRLVRLTADDRSGAARESHVFDWLDTYLS